MNLVDLWQRHAGEPVHVLGNGWSLDRIPDGVTIGVNRVWRLGIPDYWYTIDQDVYAELASPDARPDELLEADWVVSPNIIPSVVPRDGVRFAPPDERILLTPLARIDDRPGLFPPEAVTRQFCEAGTFAGQRLRPGRAPKPGALWGENSSVDRCLHLALILGASEVHLHGVDLALEPGTGRRRFCDPVPTTGLQRDEAEKSTGQLIVHRRNLERFARAWRERVRLVSHSPAAGLEGWEATCPRVNG